MIHGSTHDPRGPLTERWPGGGDAGREHEQPWPASPPSGYHPSCNPPRSAPAYGPPGRRPGATSGKLNKSMMDDMTRRVLLGAGVGVGTMTVVALLVVAVLALRQKLLEREDEQLLQDGRRRRRDRMDSALTVSTHHSEGGQTVSEHSITHGMAYNRRSFSLPNGYPTEPEPGYDYDPTLLQPLHQGYNDPFHHRQVNQEGTHGAASHARSGSPAVVPFRESRLPIAGVHYSHDGHLRSKNTAQAQEDPAFFYGLRNRPEPGHRLRLAYATDRGGLDVLGEPHRPSLSNQESHSSLTVDREELYEKNWEQEYRKYSASSDQGLWSLDKYRRGPRPQRQASEDSSDQEEQWHHRKHRDKNKNKNKNKQKKNNTEDFKLDNIDHQHPGMSRLPRDQISRNNINDSSSIPVQDHVYY